MAHYRDADAIYLDDNAYCLRWTPFLDGDEADSLLRQLTQHLAWQQLHVRLYGREHPSPRLSAWYGEPGVTYRYSGITLTATGWTPPLARLRDAIEATTGKRFNAVLANLYRAGDDAMGWHSDDEPELGDAPWIASYNLGATRDFTFRRRGQTRQCAKLALVHNQLLLMNPAVQHQYQHALPRRKRVIAPRINLTFRHILAG